MLLRRGVLRMKTGARNVFPGSSLVNPITWKNRVSISLPRYGAFGGGQWLGEVQPKASREDTKEKLREESRQRVAPAYIADYLAFSIAPRHARPAAARSSSACASDTNAASN